MANKIAGIDVHRKVLMVASINEIYRYAKICRVSNVIRPYMEAL